MPSESHRNPPPGATMTAAPLALRAVVAGAFGFDALAGFTHHCESAFDRVRKGEVAATAEAVFAGTRVLLPPCPGGAPSRR